ncbi:uncharacterized protein MYCFIDRAFT_191773 [Pseudocercospora fijiensis CIRAD86]|uniref:Zn(2)-C6 fungal-type domain-containing protein n=1 Tax=Pseudocercospora fijiensis (strain CIRAD86) TaxID=383855 RepID=N1Q8T7_PSEFD|nr:uncharacterized protein MYCFIDRAFT_191773 [Pseudocercospora fijiensis CIRAD86]EME87298.1 hypothetical protein MYCFIDRAFT_191773 [Pseudocercospora fijiensis CIRAD86]
MHLAHSSMSDKPSPTSADERVYRFISDPSHKENLSGRVRAACLTCRRKKIKCSGERNCRTCREKGLFCEGFPARKRLKKEGGFESILAPVPAGIDRKGKGSSVKKSSPKQSKLSLRSAVADNNGVSGDIPHDSEQSSSTDVHSALSAELGQRVAIDAKHDSRSSRQLEALAPYQVDTWRLDDHLRAQPSTLPQQVATPPTGFITSAPPEQTSFNWTEMQDDEDWWTDRIIDASGLSRRQTIASFLPSPGGNQFESRYEVPQPYIGPFDDLALLLANSRAPTVLNSSAGDFSSWWDVSNMTPAFLGQAQGVERERLPPPFQHTPTSQCSGIATQQQSADAFFDHLWNNMPPE